MCKLELKSKDAIVFAVGKKKYVFVPQANGLYSPITGKERQKHLRRGSSLRTFPLEANGCVQKVFEAAVSVKLSVDGKLIVVQGTYDISFFLKAANKALYSLCWKACADSFFMSCGERVIVVDTCCFKKILYRDKDNKLKQLNDNFLSVDVCKNGEILATSTSYRSTLYFYDESKKELITLGYC